MMRANANVGGGLHGSSGSGSGSGSGSDSSGQEWEMRPGGMLVQKRNPDLDRNAAPPPPKIRVRVKHGSIYREISISSAATFGDLKKMLMGPTGLHHQDQKLIYKGKERNSNAFLDIVGVKDRSKIVLVVDPISQERRLLEMRRSTKVEKASKSISEISLEVDRLAVQVSSLESVISKGGKVAEPDVVTLIELLMNQLLKLDGINIADGDLKLQRKLQVRRVQKYVETLDTLKIKNSMPSPQQVHSDELNPSVAQPRQSKQLNGHPPTQLWQEQPLLLKPASEQPPRHSASRTVVTTKWETFDQVPPLIPVTTAASMSTLTIGKDNHVQPKLHWEFFE